MQTVDRILKENINDYSNANELASGDRVGIQTKNGLVRVPRSTLVDQPPMEEPTSTRSTKIFPGDFKKHAHRFTRSFSWKTKPDKPSFAQMQPLPKLIKRPGYTEICCKNICWPAHQFCLCCGRNTAEGCRKWSRSTGEYDYNRACWSSCALCSDDAYKILNTPIIFKEKIIDPELLLPLDAELLYYSIQSAKLRKERQQNSSAKTESPKKSKFALPFSKKMKGLGSLFGKKKRSRKAESSRSAPRKKKKKKKKKSKRKSSRSKRRSRSKSKRSKKRSKSKPKKSNKHSRRKSNRSKKRSQSKSRR